MRRLFVLIHRYVGLAMAGFLFIAGLTGAVLVWYHELDAAVNPQWMHVTPPFPTAQPLDPLVLREKVLATYPGAQVNYVELHLFPGEAVRFWLQPGIDPATGGEQPLPADQVFVDPYTGRILGDRLVGEISHGWHNLLPFIFDLHYALALGQTGMWIMGVVALLWTIDCFVGVFLTLPAPQRRRESQWARVPKWWQRWKPSWRVRWSGGNYKLNYDLHRAGGLWPWALLLVLAWSSVAFNLQAVYQPVMRLLFDMQEDPRKLAPIRAQPQPEPSLPWEEAARIGHTLLEQTGTESGFSVIHPQSLAYDPKTATYRYRARSDLDIRDRGGRTTAVFDANTGALIGTHLPTGKSAGDTITSWLLALHMANVWGIPFRIVMTLAGLAVALLSATGIYIWWKKRAIRFKGKTGERAPTFHSTPPSHPVRNE